MSVRSPSSEFSSLKSLLLEILDAGTEIHRKGLIFVRYPFQKSIGTGI